MLSLGVLYLFIKVSGQFPEIFSCPPPRNMVMTSNLTIPRVVCHAVNKAKASVTDDGIECWFRKE